MTLRHRWRLREATVSVRMAENRRKQRSDEARYRRIVVHDGLEDAREVQSSPQPPDLNLPDRSQDVKDLIIRISKV